VLTVFGSINLDLSMQIERLPSPGETLLGADALVTPGGKGANQAHAAALFGVPTRMHGMVGEDGFAGSALASLVADGVRTSGVGTAKSRSTGLAVVTVDRTGENAIVVAPGANLYARAEQVSDDALAGTRVLLLQLEVPQRESIALARRAKRLGCLVIMNASPMPSDFHVDADEVDMLIVNRSELAQLCAQHSLAAADPRADAEWVAQAMAIDILVTLGAGGSILARRDASVVEVRASPVRVVDTTGAGDTYAGVFAAALASGESAQSAMESASEAAGLACMRSGAQAAQPNREQIEAALAKRRMQG